MTPTEFIDSLYVGDRGCTRIDIDGKLSQFRMHIDVLSRIRHPSGLWHYYTDEDIVDAILVFEGVTALKMHSDDGMPYDFINGLEVIRTTDSTATVSLRVGCSQDGTGAEAVFEITFTAVFVVDPRKPSERVVS